MTFLAYYNLSMMGEIRDGEKGEGRFSPTPILFLIFVLLDPEMLGKNVSSGGATF